ncbi:MAG: hypothetical protein HY680_01445 [Chloroflexi bacterium]|nr:hypothetical protein [Chloroflexota bacterium]
MPKSITATSINLESIQVQRDQAGVVDGLWATLNVAYGESHVREEYDLWTELSPTQRDAVQDLYDTLVQSAQTTYLA